MGLKVKDFGDNCEWWQMLIFRLQLWTCSSSVGRSGEMKLSEMLVLKNPVCNLFEIRFKVKFLHLGFNCERAQGSVERSGEINLFKILILKNPVLKLFEMGFKVKYLYLGFNCERVRGSVGRSRGLTFLIWDVGGQEKVRPLWKSYTR